MAVEQQSSEKMEVFSTSSQTIAGEPLAYPATSEPEVTAAIFTMGPGTQSQWMVHPVQGFLYVLEGTLTVEFADDGPGRALSLAPLFCRHGRNGIEDETTVTPSRASWRFSPVPSTFLPCFSRRWAWRRAGTKRHR
jgi:hypothetical protein